jgi:hypothetical protein
LGLAWTSATGPCISVRGNPRSHASLSSPSATRVATAISSITGTRGFIAGVLLANSISDAGRASISSVLPSTPSQPSSRTRSTISRGLDPPSARSPPCRIRSGEFAADPPLRPRMPPGCRECPTRPRCAPEFSALSRSGYYQERPPAAFDYPAHSSENKARHFSRIPVLGLQMCGPVAQLGARFHGMEEVVGSIPTRSTIFSLTDLPTDRLVAFGSKLQKHFQSAA